MLSQQNETAIDVAKRKDHGEIILIITSQPKTKKDKKKGKKSEKEKLFVDLEGEKKKRGFFFRRKSKAKVRLSVERHFQSLDLEGRS